ncbi:MAG: sigma-70 family RNA polymerase sigma factor [Clostridiales bacterium]|nr:sigma-70 family RNA polymerase sigma factor [Clostridiales bacterium]
MEARQWQDERFVEALKLHRSAMYRVAHAMLRSQTDAEDAVSTATVNAYQHISRLRSWDAVRPWLMRITVNACNTTLRKRKREIPYDTQSYLESTQVYRDETPIWMYIEMLPPAYASLMQMRYGEGMSLDEIGQSLSLSKGTVSSKLTRGKQKLRQIMEKEADLP